MNPLPSFTREPIYAAIFAFWQSLTVGGAPAFKTATRKTKHWDDVPAEDQPALLQMQRREIAKYRKGLPTIWDCEISLFLYVRSNQLIDTSQVASVLLNPLLDAITNALVVDDIANNCCTLGGLVSHCAIEGAIEIYEGDLGDEAVAVIPVTFRVTP